MIFVIVKVPKMKDIMRRLFVDGMLQGNQDSLHFRLNVMIPYCEKLMTELYMEFFSAYDDLEAATKATPDLQKMNGGRDYFGILQINMKKSDFYIWLEKYKNNRVNLSEAFSFIYNKATMPRAEDRRIVKDGKSRPVDLSSFPGIPAGDSSNDRYVVYGSREDKLSAQFPILSAPFDRFILRQVMDFKPKFVKLNVSSEEYFNWQRQNNINGMIVSPEIIKDFHQFNGSLDAVESDETTLIEKWQGLVLSDLPTKQKSALLKRPLRDPKEDKYSYDSAFVTTVSNSASSSSSSVQSSVSPASTIVLDSSGPFGSGSSSSSSSGSISGSNQLLEMTTFSESDKRSRRRSSIVTVVRDGSAPSFNSSSTSSTSSPALTRECEKHRYMDLSKNNPVKPLKMTSHRPPSSSSSSSSTSGSGLWSRSSSSSSPSSSSSSSTTGSNQSSDQRKIEPGPIESMFLSLTK